MDLGTSGILSYQKGAFGHIERLELKTGISQGTYEYMHNPQTQTTLCRWSEGRGQGLGGRGQRGQMREEMGSFVTVSIVKLKYKKDACQGA